MIPITTRPRLARANTIYLVNGSWQGSWEGLPRDVIIYKWGSAKPVRDGTKWFADRGHRLVLSGAPVDKWLRETAGLPGIIGFSYTTWDGDYSGMGRFFQEIREWKGAPAAGGPDSVVETDEE